MKLMVPWTALSFPRQIQQHGIRPQCVDKIRMNGIPVTTIGSAHMNRIFYPASIGTVPG
jgi:hypothetical protein